MRQRKSEKNLPNGLMFLPAYDLLTQPVKAANVVCKVLTPLKTRRSIAEFKPEAKSEIKSSEKSEVKPASTVNLNVEPPSLSQSTDATEEDDYEDGIELPTRIEFDKEEEEPDQSMSKYASGELRTSLEEIASKMKAHEEQHRERRSRAKLQRLRFKSEINPNQNNNAEAELQREIGKEDFARMDIIGQFNLGFIIVKLEDDLFIVDQHATDEKYNFETLQRTTQLEYQRLTVPQSLDLTAVNEMVLIDHLAVFEKNGFKFEINHDGEIFICAFVL